MSSAHAPTPTVLSGHEVDLVPLGPTHAPDLARVVDAETFIYFPPPFAPPSIDEEGMRAYINGRLSQPGTVAFAILRRATGRAVGSTCFLDVCPEHGTLEIGATFLGHADRGTRVNPEAKRLMLAHAFETLGCVRVQLKCDALNVRSRRAIERLGARLEGVLRRHRRMPDGRLRDTVVYSIIAEEWPEVRRGLDARLA